MKKFFALALTLVMALSLLSGCATEKKEEGPAAPVASGEAGALPGEGEVYALICNWHGLEFFNATKSGVYNACEELGATWYMGGQAGNGTAEDIIEAIEQAVANKVTGIVLHGQLDDCADAMKAAMDAGVPIIGIDTDIGGTDDYRLSFIGTSPEQLGVYMAHDAAELLGGKGEVVLTGMTTQPSNNRTWDEIERIFAEQYPDMKIVAKLHDNADSQEAAAQVGAALQTNPDIDLVIGTQAPSGVGAATAVREAGMEGKVKVICRDRDEATLQAIKNGEIESTWVQTTYIQSYTAVMWLHQYVNGKLALVPDYQGLGLNPLPAFAEASMVRLDASNVENFLGATYEYEITAKN